MTNVSDSFYESSDLGLSTALSIFYPIWAINKTNPTKAIFVFQREDGIDKIIESYFKNDLNISALAFFNQLRTVKSRLYENK